MAPKLGQHRKIGGKGKTAVKRSGSTPPIGGNQDSLQDTLTVQPEPLETLPEPTNDKAPQTGKRRTLEDPEAQTIANNKIKLSAAFRFSDHAPGLKELKGNANDLTRNLDKFATAVQDTYIGADARNIVGVGHAMQSLTSTIEAPDSILPHVAKHEQKAGQAQRAWDDVRTGGNKNIFKRIGNRVKASVKQRGADSAERQRNKASAEYDKLCDQAVPKLDQFKGSWMSVDSAIEGDAIIDTALESIRTAARRSIADPRFKELRDQHFFVGQDIQDFNSTAQEQEHKTVKRN